MLPALDNLELMVNAVNNVSNGREAPGVQNAHNGLLDAIDGADEWREIKGRDFSGAQPDKLKKALLGVILQSGGVVRISLIYKKRKVPQPLAKVSVLPVPLLTLR